MFRRLSTVKIECGREAATSTIFIWHTNSTAFQWAYTGTQEFVGTLPGVQTTTRHASKLFRNVNRIEYYFGEHYGKSLYTTSYFNPLV